MIAIINHFRGLAPAVLLIALIVGCSANEDSRSDALVGMYSDHPKIDFAVWSGAYQEWSGSLVIDGSCVYLDIAQRDGVMLKPHETLRALVRLPKLLTEHSPANNKLSVAGAGLLGDGDQVVIAGFSGGIPNSDSSLKYIREECRAHVAFFAAIMTSPADYATTVPLAGLFPFGTKSSLIDIGSDGILVIEPPCIYFEDARDFGDDETSDPPHVRYFLKLARPLVRFNKSDNLLWMGEHGPMTSGDWVTIGPGEHRGDDEGENVYSGNIYEDECFTEHETSAAWMHPRWMSPLTR